MARLRCGRVGAPNVKAGENVIVLPGSFFAFLLRKRAYDVKRLINF